MEWEWQINGNDKSSHPVEEFTINVNTWRSRIM